MHLLRRSAVVALVVLAASALASPAYASYKAKITGGVLTFTGNSAGDKLVLRLKPGGATKVQADVGGNGTIDFEFGRGLFTSIVVNAGGGNDVVLIKEAFGVFTTTEATTLRGGGGKDRLTGGSGGESLSGGPGADKLVGRDGPDSFLWKSGDGNDAIDGQNGSDTVNIVGSAGTDVQTLSESATNLRVQTGPAVVVAEAVEGATVAALDGADQIEVGDLTGTGVGAVELTLDVNGLADLFDDTVILDGAGGVDVVSAASSAGHVLVNGFPATVDISGSGATDRLTVNGRDGNDTLSGNAGLAGLIQLTLDGGDGNDTLNGGNGADIVIAGAGNDGVDANSGNDTVFLGDGNDTAQWDPGDGSDIVEGQAGTDLLDFNGSAGAEIFAASSNGGRLLFTRNVGSIVMDVDDVELVDLAALGGTDTVTVNDLAATDVTDVTLDLGVGASGDLAADAVTVNGTTAVDLFNVSGSAGNVLVQSVSLGVSIIRAEPANDMLTVNLSSGDDIFSASSLAGTSVVLTVNGGNGNDVIVGSQGPDTIDGGPNTDYVDGGAGIDSATNAETIVNVP
jgi:Ca2+-binding RTX toxin-like protein